MARVALATGLGLFLATPGGRRAGARERPSTVEVPPPVSPIVVERETIRMGTRLRIRVSASSRHAGIEAIDRAFEEVARLEGVLSSWRRESAISRLNRAAPGTAVRIPAELGSMLARAFRWRRATDGAFDPAIGALVDAWDLRGRGRHPSPREIEAALAASGSGTVRVTAGGTEAVRAEGRAWIDAGGFGKGAALDAARRVLRAADARGGVLDFGGQVLAFGNAGRGRGVVVGIADPRKRDRPVATLRLRDASAATSAQSERFVDVDGERLGHVLDPRSGRPVPAWGGVTVVADDPFVADVLSTALLVLGPEDGLAWARAHPDVGALFLIASEKGLQARWSESLDGILELGPDVERGGR
ncbi:MAG: FAD:protein FMN transferase [Gemmatimonadota bacterium]